MSRIRITSQISEARAKHAEALEKMEEADAKLQALPDDAEPSEVDFHNGYFERCKSEAERWSSTVDRLVAIEEARGLVKSDEDDEDPEARGIADAAHRISGGASPRVSIKNERGNLTYRKGGDHSYYRDLYRAQTLQDEGARKRLQRHGLEMKVETRDVTSDDGAAGFIPPIYLAEQWIDLPRPRRPFADAVPSIPLAASGMSMDFPKLTVGADVAAQDGEATEVANRDPDSDTYQVPVRTISGYVDLSVQAFERSRPGFDEVVFRDLTRAYDARLDTYLLAGTNNNGQHRGLRNIVGIMTATQSSGNASDTVKKIYEAASKVSTAIHSDATAVVMHPRRAHALAAFMTDEHPLLQLGALPNAVGTQAGAVAQNIAGLRLVRDANISTNLGSGTNEDEIYVVALDELMLAEGEPRTDVFRDARSDELVVRVVLRAYSAAALGRLPGAICRISGAGLSTPSFT